jgi:hypothetical protein
MADHRVSNAAKALPSQSVLHQLLRYERETGKLYWKERPVEWFTPSATRSAVHMAANWNAIYAGKSALDSPHSQGYLEGKLLGSRVLAHRVIFKMLHGTEPPEIDHDNGDKSDNRPLNLNGSAHATNMKNQKMRTDNTSGIVGVVWKKLENKWAASIGDGGRSIHLGVFSDFKDAVSARRAAEVARGYHPNHGR